MKTATMNRLLIKATVHRTLERLTEAPEREIRNLIDMAWPFPTAVFKSKFSLLHKQCCKIQIAPTTHWLIKQQTTLTTNAYSPLA